MPYAIHKQDGKYAVVNRATGKVHGRHPSKKRAVRQVRALYAATGGKTLIGFGGAVKAMDDATRRIGGWLALFGSPAEPDLQGEHFTKATDFGPASRVRFRFHHGIDPVLGLLPLGDAELTRKDEGVWCEGVVSIKAEDCDRWAAGIRDRRDRYEARIYEMVKAGKLGFSSSAAPHLVRKKAGEILSWPLADDATISPTPVDHRNVIVPLKSVIDPGADPAPPEVRRPKPITIARFLMHGHALRGLRPGG